MFPLSDCLPTIQLYTLWTDCVSYKPTASSQSSTWIEGTSVTCSHHPHLPPSLALSQEPFSQGLSMVLEALATQIHPHPLDYIAYENIQRLPSPVVYSTHHDAPNNGIVTTTTKAYYHSSMSAITTVEPWYCTVK